MSAQEKQAEHDFMLANIKWAEKWLAVPESDLPGALTHDKCRQVLFDNEDAIHDLRLGGKFTADGKFAGF